MLFASNILSDSSTQRARKSSTEMLLAVAGSFPGTSKTVLGVVCTLCTPSDVVSRDILIIPGETVVMLVTAPNRPCPELAEVRVSSFCATLPAKSLAIISIKLGPSLRGTETLKCPVASSPTSCPFTLTVASGEALPSRETRWEETTLLSAGDATSSSSSSE